MKRRKVDWSKLVIERGYRDIVHMLTDLYVDKQVDAHILALNLDISISTLRFKLSELGIRRKRKKTNKNF